MSAPPATTPMTTPEPVAPEALLSLMARLGSSQPVELKMTLGELADGFDLSQFGTSPTKFDAEDLWPLTRERNQHLPFAAAYAVLAGLVALLSLQRRPAPAD